MFIIYEYAACVGVAAICAMLLCAAYVMSLLLKRGAGSVARTLQELTPGAIGLVARSGMTTGPREP
jgi:hypothetical protein